MRFGWLVALVMLAIADPALADITARFAQPDGQPIAIQVDDRGDSRMALTDCVYVPTKGERFGTLIRLEAVETGPVPAAFAVPGAPIGGAALRQRLLDEAGRQGPM